jgi:prepilin peptidase CpaA
MLEYPFVFVFPFMMIFSSFSDLFSMNISNKVSLILVVAFVGFAFTLGMDFHTILWHFLTFALVLVVGFILFALNIIGGGDAKLAASTALWLGWAHTGPYIVLASFIGGLLTLLILKFRSGLIPEKLNSLEWVLRLHDSKNGAPYGIALGLAALIIYPSTPWMEQIIALTVGS